jgi:2Fe-2S ferredoxin
MKRAFKATFIEDNGIPHTIDVPEGWSLMEGAVKHLVPGIDADCGGACACATCHVYIEPDWTAKLEPKNDAEEAMLDFAPGVKPNSRLSCQIRMTESLDGIVMRVPKSQQ